MQSGRLHALSCSGIRAKKRRSSDSASRLSGLTTNRPPDSIRSATNMLIGLVCRSVASFLRSSSYGSQRAARQDSSAHGLGPRDWYQAGVWRRLHQALLEELALADRIDWDRAALNSAVVPAPGSPETSKNPTDRGKQGTKRHLVVDAHSIPLAVLVSAANVHDSKMMLATVDAIEPIRAKTRGRPRRRPHKLHADKGYDYRHLQAPHHPPHRPLW